MSGQGRVRLDRIRVRYADRPILQELSLEIAPGEFVCLLGPSGCGKTTTLRAIAGLIRVEAGAIYIDGRLANDLPAHRRGIAMVFQDLALFPHMTATENIAFGLRLRRVPTTEARARIAAMVALLHLGGMEQRLPKQLSGGQQQRVALARSLVVDPAVLLLDEPFAALDRGLRDELRREVRALQRRLGITVVFVTHDQEEALTMADRVVVMNDGVIEQVGTPSDVYEAPQSRFVLNFLGFANFLKVTAIRRTGGTLECQVAGRPVAVAKASLPQEGARPAELAIRPERLRASDPGNDGAPLNRVPGTVEDVTYEGALVAYGIVLEDGQRVLVREQNRGAAAGSRLRVLGDRVSIAWDPTDALLFT
jgi:spermidine/putrescine ABC transporter ATP-binding subunit